MRGIPDRTAARTVLLVVNGFVFLHTASSCESAGDMAPLPELSQVERGSRKNKHSTCERVMQTSHGPTSL